MERCKVKYLPVWTSDRYDASVVNIESPDIAEDGSVTKHNTAESLSRVPCYGVEGLVARVFSRLPRVSFLESWEQVAVFFTYIALYLCYSAWVHVTSSATYSPSMLVMAVLFTKLFVSFAAYLIVDGTLSELLQTLLKYRRSLFFYAFPAIAYATTDSLTVVCLRNLDPATFAILYNVRVAFMLLLFQRLLRVTLQRNHWIAMLCIVLGCMVKELPGMLAATHATAEIEDSFTRMSRPKAIILLVVMAQLAAFAAVYNEKLLKEDSLPLNIQNMALYSWAILAATVYSILWPTTKTAGIWSALMRPSEWLVIWTYPVVIAVFLSAAYGLVTSFFIKSLNNVVREIACAIQIVGTVPINAFVLGYAVRFADVLAVVMIVLGVSIYNRNPIRKH